MGKGLIVVVVLVLIALFVFGQYVGVRNTLVTKNEAVKAAWSQVDIALQRRADLIPNLVETVKGYAQQEQTVFGDIAKARSALLSAGNPADKIKANGELDGAIGRLLVLVENYPQLKSNENFMRLQDELAGTENRIAVERKRYNDTLQDYNTYIQLFPKNIFAGWAGFKPNDAYFAASEGSRQVPKVNFNPGASTAAPPTPQPAPARPARAIFYPNWGGGRAAPQPGPSFLDLRENPAAIAEIPEAAQWPELAEFLLAINAHSSPLLSAKCDAWFTTEITPEDEIFGMGGKFGGYIDVVFVDEEKRFSFVHHEDLAKRVVALLKHAPHIPCSVEFLVRRCYSSERDGFYITTYCFGFGANEDAARGQWKIALKLLENALRQAARQS